MNTTTPTQGNVIVLKQLLNLIPRGMINRLAILTGFEDKARTFSVTSHLAVMIFAQLARVSDWGHSFSRLFTVTRPTLWERPDLLALMKSYGTAAGRMRVLGALDQEWLPGFAHIRI